MQANIRELKLRKAVNSYVIAQGDKPYLRLKQLQKYLKATKICNIHIEDLRNMVDNQMKLMENRDRKDRMEALLFTRDGEPKRNRYGNAFCKRCHMYKDYDKECPYCGSLELTL